MRKRQLREYTLICKIRSHIKFGSAMDSGILRVFKVWLVGGLTGSGTGVCFILIHNALTTDLIFHLWEFGVALATPALIALLVARATKSNVGILMAIAYLTLLIPVLGASFGAAGSEPLWLFAALGLVGGLVWGTPFAIWQMTKMGSDTK